MGQSQSNNPHKCNSLSYPPISVPNQRSVPNKKISMKPIDQYLAKRSVPNQRIRAKLKDQYQAKDQHQTLRQDGNEY